VGYLWEIHYWAGVDAVGAGAGRAAGGHEKGQSGEGGRNLAEIIGNRGYLMKDDRA